MNSKAPAAFYEERIRSMELEHQQFRKKGQALAIFRGFSFLAAITLAWLLWPHGWPVAIAAAVAALSVFIYFVSLDLANKKTTDNCAVLLQINREELQYLQHHLALEGDGTEWEEPEHAYAHDLDIFGRASLFRYINRCNAGSANRMLASWLQHPADTATAVSRQEAARELSGKPEWCQQLQAFGRTSRISIGTETHISNWVARPASIRTQRHWKIIRIIFPALGLSCLGLYLADIIPWSLFISIMLLFLAGAMYITKQLMPAWAELGKITAELESFSASIRHLEQASFTSPLLREMLQRIAVSHDRKASAQVRDLRKIMDKLDYRLNPVVFIPLSAFLCWDLQQVFALEKWKMQNAAAIRDWFGAIAQTEVLCTLGTLTFNHPDWCFPEFSDGDAVLEASALGHPLIPAGKRVCSDFSTSGKGRINLITGSNMAGKSTFLRSTGINIILAMSGAPVCARSLTLSPFRVMSSMRISDNLEESTSTFYAELKKLKTIIEAVDRNEPVFLLLDEILRGTNSADRHAGSGALIRQLIRQQAAGMVATHDLELAKLSAEFPDSIRNYHFDVQIDGEELYFDYKLKDGICTSMNASLLMKKIGIKMQ